ncbi:unnamed protein product [Aureobasidium mustum]|uniref:Uncharacterized protein n=1 Tax=Aureobasidium mustum TaxID=2773714 RepID=A0A9N8PCZ9_9PEZI|nr:unnamed protein product [Aureobasidium mustum]
MCYERLRNSVTGSAQACSRISDELLETSMQRQTACMQPAFGLLQAEFLVMHYTLRDLQCALGTSKWHENATVTVKCVQEVCQQVSNQFRDIIQASQIWDIVTPDHINDKLHALAITLQEQQMTVELLIVVMAFFDYSITAPSVIYQYKIHCQYVDRHVCTFQGLTCVYSELKRFDNFLHGIIEGVLARRAMRQDILKLRSSSQQLEDRPYEELPDADAWSPSQSTVTMGVMTPTEN